MNDAEILETCFGYCILYGLVVSMGVNTNGIVV